MPEKTLYLDNNATTQVDPDVLEAMLPWVGTQYGNPSSPTTPGRFARECVQKAREQVARLIGARDAEIIFTSCGTESINSAIRSACTLDSNKRHIVTSAVEHSATLKLCEQLARDGYEITRLPVNSTGLLDVESLRAALREDTALATLLWANNETGVLFPVEEISAACRNKKVPLHLDAVQVVGKVSVDVNETDPDFLSLSGHKLHAPKGVGALFVNRRIRFQPMLQGSQEQGRRGGTENVASIVGLGAAAELAHHSLAAEQNRIRAIRDRFESRVLESVPGSSVNGDLEHRLPNTSNLAFDGIEAEGALMMLDERGLYCSTGSACTSGSVAPSHVLTAMGLNSTRAKGSLRFSFGRFNTEADATHAAELVSITIKKLRSLQSGSGSVVFAR